MNVQLLLLLALAGPFCAFTHASPTALPTELDVVNTDVVTQAAPEVTDAPVEEHTVITGPPPTEPNVAPEVVEVTEAVTESAPPATPALTEEPAAETEAHTAAATAAAESHVTDAPAAETVETAAPSEPEGGQTEPVATAASGALPGDDVVITDDIQEGLSSGQVVGIVIGALLAVIVLIAVVIAVVRRMGKYSP